MKMTASTVRGTNNIKFANSIFRRKNLLLRFFHPTIHRCKSS